MATVRHHSLLLLLFVTVLLSSIVCSYASSRKLHVSISPSKNPISVPSDPRLVLTSDIAPSDARVKKQSSGCQQPEQVHLTYWSGTSVLVSWASCDAKLRQTTPLPTSNVTSVVFYGTNSSNLDQRAQGVATSYAYDYKDTGAISYASPVLHHVLLKGLQPGSTYYYRVADTTVGGQGDTEAKLKASRDSRKGFSFTLPKPGNFPLNIGVIGDPGQTYNSSETLKRLIASDPQLLILLGDFAYADEWVNATQRKASKSDGTYQPKWDTWGPLFEPLLAKVPFMHVDGNHEIEPLPNGHRGVSYNNRFPTPQLSGHDYSKGPTSFPPVSKANPFANLYYTVEVPGVMTYIALSSYAPGQTFDHSEEMYKWLVQTLDKVDRNKTPWLIVAVHVPLYNSYAKHFKEVECFRQSYEPLLVQHGVDIVLNGHVHAYERIKPVVNYKVDECGPMYLTVGDGGNVEGINTEFVDGGAKGPPAFCKDPQANSNKLFPPRYQPQACFSYQDGKFCPTQQPEWSAYREPSFGFGTLELQSATQAKWTWRKNQWPSWQVADEVVIYRTPNKSDCGRKN